MATKRRKYTREFKLDAVRMVVENELTLSEVAKNLGIDRSLVGNWKKQFEADGSVAFPGNGRLKPEDDEVRRLRRELAQVREERDILGKALAYFSKEQK